MKRLLLLLSLVAGISVMALATEQHFTINYKTFTSDDSNAYTESHDDLCETDSKGIATFGDKANIFKGQYGVKFSSNNNEGSMTINFTTKYIFNATKVVIDWSSTKTISFTVGDKSPDSVSGYLFTFNLNGSPLSTLTIKNPKAQQGYLVSITVYYDDGESGGGNTNPPSQNPEWIMDELTTTSLGLSGNSYDLFEKTFNGEGQSGATYAGRASNSNGIQLNKNAEKGYGIMVTNSPGKVKKLVIHWYTGVTSRTLNVYASNNPYIYAESGDHLGAKDLYASGLTTVTTIASSNATNHISTYEFTDDYAYFGIQSSKDALQIDKIEVYWEPANVSSLTTPSFTVTTDGEYETLFTNDVEVRISAGDGTTIYYTTDPVTEVPENPATASGWSVYSGALTYHATTTITAVAVKDGDVSSPSTVTVTCIAPYVIDRLTADGLGIENKIAYTDFSEKYFSSYAVYAGNIAKSDDNHGNSIQITNRPKETDKAGNTGIITTASGGNLKGVVVNWNDWETKTDAVLYIYGSNTAFTYTENQGADQLYDTDFIDNNLTLLATLADNNTINDVAVAGEYQYVAFKASKPINLDWIKVIWDGDARPLPPADPTFEVDTDDTGNKFDELASVTISCETDGAAIYYVLEDATVVPADVTTAWELYTTDIYVDETTTISAVAVKDGLVSNISKITLTKNVVVTSVIFYPHGQEFTGTEITNIDNQYTNNNSSNDHNAMGDYKGGVITLTLGDGGNGSKPLVDNAGALRLYAKNTLEFKAERSYRISKVTITHTAFKNNYNITKDGKSDGALNAPRNVTTWNLTDDWGNPLEGVGVQTLKFTEAGTKDNNQITEIEVEYFKEDIPMVLPDPDLHPEVYNFRIYPTNANSNVYMVSTATDGYTDALKTDPDALIALAKQTCPDGLPAGKEIVVPQDDSNHTWYAVEEYHHGVTSRVVDITYKGSATVYDDFDGFDVDDNRCYGEVSHALYTLSEGATVSGGTITLSSLGNALYTSISGGKISDIVIDATAATESTLKVYVSKTPYIAEMIAAEQFGDLLREKSGTIVVCNGSLKNVPQGSSTIDWSDLDEYSYFAIVADGTVQINNISVAWEPRYYNLDDFVRQQSEIHVRYDGDLVVQGVFQHIANSEHMVYVEDLDGNPMLLKGAEYSGLKPGDKISGFNLAYTRHNDAHAAAYAGTITSDGTAEYGPTTYVKDLPLSVHKYVHLPEVWGDEDGVLESNDVLFYVEDEILEYNGGALTSRRRAPSASTLGNVADMETTKAYDTDIVITGETDGGYTASFVSANQSQTPKPQIFYSYVEAGDNGADYYKVAYNETDDPADYEDYTVYYVLSMRRDYVFKDIATETDWTTAAELLDTWLADVPHVTAPDGNGPTPAPAYKKNMSDFDDVVFTTKPTETTKQTGIASHIDIESNAIIRALAVKDGYLPSDEVHMGNVGVMPTSVGSIMTDGTDSNVYTTTGICVMTDATPADLHRLTPGIYIYAGRLILIRK